MRAIKKHFFIYHRMQSLLLFLLFLIVFIFISFQSSKWRRRRGEYENGKKFVNFHHFNFFFNFYWHHPSRILYSKVNYFVYPLLKPSSSSSVFVFPLFANSFLIPTTSFSATRTSAYVDSSPFGSPLLRRRKNEFFLPNRKPTSSTTTPSKLIGNQNLIRIRKQSRIFSHIVNVSEDEDRRGSEASGEYDKNCGSSSLKSSILQLRKTKNLHRFLEIFKSNNHCLMSFSNFFSHRLLHPLFFFTKSKLLCQISDIKIDEEKHETDEKSESFPYNNNSNNNTNKTHLYLLKNSTTTTIDKTITTTTPTTATSLPSQNPSSSVTSQNLSKEIVDSSSSTSSFSPPHFDFYLSRESRSPYLPKFVPRWLYRMPPILQCICAIFFYSLHMLVLSKTSVPLPFQLIPNNSGLFQSIGLDTFAGLLILFLIGLNRKLMGYSSSIPRIVSCKYPPPWEIPKKAKNKIFLVLSILLLAYAASGYGAFLVEWILYGLAAFGIPINIALHRSLQVLLGHLLWVIAGCAILERSFSPFFPPKGRWYKLRWNSNWLWWVVGGYFGSSMLFNIADFINQFVIPPLIVPEGETIVSKMVNPENNDLFAMAMGATAPCLSAPWWEEVLYRGFTLPALSLFTPTSFSVPLSALLFAAHHMSMQSMIPLAVLGFAWAVFYIQSKNLLVTILIHAMWNSRVFLGSLLGL